MLWSPWSADDAASRTVWLAEGRRGRDHEAPARSRSNAPRCRISTRSIFRANCVGRGFCLCRQPRHRPAGCGSLRKADAAGRRRARRFSNRPRPFLVPLSSTNPPFSGAVGTGTVYKLINNLMGAIQIAGDR